TEKNQQAVSGSVIDAASGDVLPGVNIMIKGTTIGTSSDANGSFELEVPSPQTDTLVVSFIGYQTNKIPVNGRSKLTIELQPEAIMGEEMVVVGYGEQRKEDLTGSIKSINTEDLPSTSAGNMTEALRGGVAGLNVTGGSSSAGDNADLQVRGQNTLSAGSEPLVVLDGIIFHGSINDINMADVERMDVLKDASAAAIYGAQSANGVIIVTTKGGGQGEPTINFSTSVGVQDHTNNPVEYMNGQQYAKRLVDFSYISELYSWYDTNPTGPEDNGGRPAYPDISDPEVVSGYLKSQEEVENYLAGNEVNWMDEVTRIAPMQNYNLSVSGGTENVSYYVSGSHRAEEGVLVNDSFERNTLTTKVDADINDWLTLGVNSSYSNRDYSGMAVTLRAAQNTTPLAQVADENGDYPLSYNEEFLMAHPLRNTLVDNKDIRKYFAVSPRLEVDVLPVPGLSYEFNYSYNLNTETEKSSYPTSRYEQSQTGGEVETAENQFTNVLLNNIVHYDRDFAEDHAVNVTLLFSREQREGEGTNIYAERFDNQSLGYYDPSFGMISEVDGSGYEETSLAYMARLNYGYRDKYLFTGTIRRDGYSGFGENNKYATFRSLSLAWLASSENFMDQYDWLDMLKLRISYGENGNQGVGRYASLQRLGSAGYVYGSSRSIGLFPNTLGNTDLSWETTESFNLGVDFGFLENRITGSIDLFTSQTSDVLVERALPGATGYQDLWTNIGAIDNKGIDVDVSTLNITGPFQWETGFVFSMNRDKISTLYGDGKDDIGNAWFIGEPISAIYDFEHAGGVWTEEELFNGEIPDGFYPGQYK
ncbi:MAG TPA: SusC/RagA family TonB-linked outer membrane protein, partial [Fodinibius sp.]|nr:SusC/RagA family TonB-linked outer membrane protein [Fodinibius sp.]